jgi:mannose-6-phosphate isomerase-like protein (cupin superfamily)
VADPYTHLNLGEIEDAAPGNGFGERWEARVAREDLGAAQTGLTHFRLRPGRRSPFVHRHREAEEIYVVLSGAGTVKLGDQLRPVGPLDAIRIAPAVPRAFEAGPDGLELIAFGPPRRGRRRTGRRRLGEVIRLPLNPHLRRRLCRSPGTRRRR